jgi:YVTN family beta-propeller protein
MTRGRALWGLALALLIQPPTPLAAGARLFVSNFGDDTVSVIDTDLDREVETIPVGKSPFGLALRADPPLLAVANSQAANATLIDPVTLEALPRDISTGMGPEDVAFSRDGRFLFAAGYYDKVVTITDVETGERVGDSISFTAIPRRLLPSRDGRRLFVLLNSDPGAVAVVDLESRAVTANVPVGPFPSDLVLTPDGSRLLVASFDGNSVTVVDLASLAPVDTLSMDTGYGLVAHPTKPLLYSMVSFDDQVLVFDYGTRQAGASIAVGAWPTYSVITPDGRFLYVVCRDANNVVKVDTEAGEALLRIATGMTPQAAALFAPGRAGLPAGWVVAAVLVAAGLFGVWRLRRRAVSEGERPRESAPRSGRAGRMRCARARLPV